MSEGGTTKARLEAADKKLNDELALWSEQRLNPRGWRMGNEELLFRCELLALARVVKDRLGVTDDELNLMLKEITLEQLQQLRPQVMEQTAELARQQIMQGIQIRPDIDL